MVAAAAVGIAVLVIYKKRKRQ
ncbi:hypothetical protein [Gemmiger sp.]